MNKSFLPGNKKKNFECNLILHSVKEYTVDSLWGHPEVFLDEVEGHCQRDESSQENWRDGGNDADGWQTEQCGSGQGLQRGRNMLMGKHESQISNVWTLWDRASQSCGPPTWSMMLVSAENLLRICPRGVMSKNLRGGEIYTNIKYVNSNILVMSGQKASFCFGPLSL